MELWEVLELFNRKERNLLIRFALGKDAERPPLSDSFCKSVLSKSEIELSGNTWWATDYHFDWIAGAFCFYAKGVKAREAQQSDKNLVQENQEDVDLLIATSMDLIFIEAKGYSRWNKGQLESKLQRLELLRCYYRSLGLEKDRPMQFHFLVTSCGGKKPLPVNWPSWVCKVGEDPWIELELADRSPRRIVERCGEDGRKEAAGGRWHVKELKRLVADET